MNRLVNTSKIVNIGIQQGGIDTAIPEAISKDGMDNLLMFTNDDSKILDCYKLVSKDTVSNDEYNNYFCRKIKGKIFEASY